MSSVLTGNLNEEGYWGDYNGLQHTKHQILTKYLSAWFPKLTRWSGRVLYIDCNAGRGRHASGQEGSPILALSTLLNHRSASDILSRSEVNFLFFENNSSNYEHLVEEIEQFGTLPRKVNVHPYAKDYESALQQVVDDLRGRHKRLAPCFAFVDPYGFKLSMRLLNDVLSFDKSELFINFMYRYIDMAIRHDSQAANMDNLFGTDKWRKLRDIEVPLDRERETIALFSSQLNAKWVTTVSMLGPNNAVKYILLHATNHDSGRETMKDTIWNVVPDGSFQAYQKHDPKQIVLIQPEPNLQSLSDMIWAKYGGKSLKLNELYDWLLHTLYRKPHLHQVLEMERKRGRVHYNGQAQKRVPYNSNPTVSLVK